MFEIIILLTAGIGAGLVTGFIGASAVMVAAPLMVVFLGYTPYLAIGVALSVDVFSSLAATLVYKKNNKLNIKPALILLFSALVFVIVGSLISVDIPSILLGVISGFGITLTGISIFIKKEENGLIKIFDIFRKYQTLSLIGIGVLVGLNAGILGAGGGLMILMVLVMILNYGTHEAVGTSVFLMVFIALLGGIVHYINSPFSVTALTVAACSGVLGALISSNLANNFKEEVLNKLVGSAIFLLGIMLTLKNAMDFFS
ncbi:MAG: sulfite exporter TauE/SafE family protein [Patescibacteria group bacterium]